METTSTQFAPMREVTHAYLDAIAEGHHSYELTRQANDQEEAFRNTPGCFHDHDDLAHAIKKLLPLYRQVLQIEPAWDIEVVVQCPEVLRDSEAQIAWHADSWRAQLSVQCSLSLERTHRNVVHELVELSWWRTGDLHHGLISFLCEMMRHSRTLTAIAKLLSSQYRVSRNQDVERMVDLVLGITPITLLPLERVTRQKEE